MKKISLLLVLTISLIACKSKKGIPDVSDIKVNIDFQRFDMDFFSMDTIDIMAGMEKLKEKHQDFYGDFMYEILGIEGMGKDPRTIVKEFQKGYTPIYDSLKEKYKNTDWLKKEMIKAFQFVKYYFPSYQVNSIILFIGPFDAPGIALTRSGIAIGLQQYAGKNFSIYQSAEGQTLFPLYISRRFSPEYITANCMKAVVEDIFPDKSAGKPLVEQMIEKGKQWWLLDKLLPTTPDSIKTGYTKQQLDWCRESEGLIWSEIVRNGDLNSLSPVVIQTYIGEGPFTQGFSPEYSPGNIGQWIGWQIVKKYAAKNTGMKPEEVMNMDARKILEEAKYKPR